MNRPVAFGSDAPNSDLEAAIESKFAHKAFTLRGFYEDGHLHFDSNGSVQGEVHPGTWTMSVIAIDKTKVSADKVELRGSRFAEVYDSKQAKFIPHRSGQNVLIVIDRDAGQADTMVLNAIERIFLSAHDRLADLVPSYWKPILSGALETVPQEDGTNCQRLKGELQRAADGSLTHPCEERAKVKSPLPPTTGIDVSSVPYRAEKGRISPPQVVFDPPPEYPELARLLKFHGTTVLSLIVNTDGNPSNIEIFYPLGVGLDEQAVTAVKKWKFKPALLNGQPVPTQIEVKVAFHFW